MIGKWKEAGCRRVVFRHSVPAVLLAIAWVSSARAEFPRFGKARAARRQAEQAIPWNELTPQAAKRLRDVMQKTTVFRTMPEETIQCDPDLYVFLVRHPEVVVDIWRHMGITRCSLKRTKPFVMEAADGAGTKSRIELVYGTPSFHVMYAEGDYSGSLTSKPIHGRCVILLYTNIHKRHPQRPAETKITSRMDVFLKLDHTGAEVVAKALHPVVGHTIDQNFKQTVQFVEQIAKVSQVNSDGMQRLALQLDSLDREVRDEFALLTAKLGRKQPAVESGGGGEIRAAN